MKISTKELWNTWRYLQRTLKSWCINWLWGFRYVFCFLGPSLPWIWSKWSTDRCKAKTRGFSDRQIAQLVSAPVPCQGNLLKRLGTNWDDGHCISANSNFIQLRCCTIPYFQSFPEFPVFNFMRVTRASQLVYLGKSTFYIQNIDGKKYHPPPKLVLYISLNMMTPWILGMLKALGTVKASLRVVKGLQLMEVQPLLPPLQDFVQQQ